MASIGFKAGEAYIEVNPSLAGWQEKLKADIEAQDTRATVPVEPELDEPAVAEIKARLTEALRNAEASMDLTEIDAQIEQLKLELEAKIKEALARQTLGVSTDEAMAKIDELGTELEAAVRERQVMLDTAAATPEIEQLKVELDEAIERPRTVHVNTTEAAAEVGALEAATAAPIEDYVGRHRIDDDSTTTEHIVVDDSEAIAATEAVRAEVESLPAEKIIVVNVDANEATAEVRLLGTVLAGLAPALVPVAGALTGMIGTSLTLFPGAISGAVALKEAFSGVGTALKDYTAMQVAAGPAATAQAQAQTAAANQVASAERGLQSARESAANGAVSAAERVVSAQQGIASAQQQAAQATQSALNQQISAEESYQNALVSEQDAQRNLIQARQDAADQLEQLAFSVQDNALSQRAASIRLTEAQNTQTSNAAPAGSLQALKDQLAIDQARQQITELADAGGDLATQKAAADKAGIDGNSKVIAAQEAVTQAVQRTGDAQRSLQQAAAAVTQAQEQGAQRVAAAEQALSDARRAQGEQALSSANSIANAQAGVASAQDAASKAMTGGTSAANTYQAALARLGPAGQQFVGFLEGLSGPSGPLAQLRAQAESGFLPGLESGISAALVAMPQFDNYIHVVGSSLGDLADKAGHSLQGGVWTTFIDYMTRIAPYAISTFGTIVGNTFSALMGYAQGYEPIFRQWGDALVRITQGWANAGQSAGGQGSAFDHFLQFVRDSGHEVADVLHQIATFIGNVAVGLQGAGLSSLTVLGAMLRGLNAINPQILGAIVSMFLAARLFGAAGIGGIVANLGARIEGAALSAGTLTLGMTGSAKAGQAVADTFGRAGSSLSKLGTALPLIGIGIVGLSLAWEQLKDKTEDAAKSAVDGTLTFGQAVDEQRGQIEKQNAVFSDSVGTTVRATNATAVYGKTAGETIRPTTDLTQAQYNQKQAYDEVTAATQALLDKMDPATRAQAEATLAQGKYTDALHNFGAGSFQANQALDDLRSKTAAASAAADAAKASTQDYRAALVALQQQIDGSLNADLAMTQATLAVSKAADDAAAAVRDHGKGSQEDQSAQVSLQQSLLSAAEAAGRKASADYQGTDSIQKAKLGADAYNISLLTAATSQNTTVRDAALGMISKLNDTELQALATTAKTDGFTLSVNNIPSGKQVDITAPGLTDVRTQVQGLATDILNIKGQQVSIFVSPTGQGGIASAGRLAGGGPISGIGDGTSDDIPALLSTGEHVFTAREVQAAGGHQAIFDLRRAILDGMAPARKFAAGGPADPVSLLVNTQASADLGTLKAGIEELGRALAAISAVSTGLPGGGAQQWAPIILQVLSLLGQPSSLLGAVERRINFESGGRPNAINLTDSNARAGHPSQGLMQTIPSTFNAYAGPFVGRGITDPLANIYAGLNYAIHRYGSIAAIDPLVRPMGYDNGGWLPPGVHTVANATGTPERVLNAAQTATFERAMAGVSHAPSGAHGGDTWNIAPPPEWDYVRVATEVERLRDLKARTQ